MAEIDDGLQLLPLFEDIQLLGMIEGIVDFADTANNSLQSSLPLSC